MKDTTTTILVVLFYYYYMCVIAIVNLLFLFGGVLSRNLYEVFTYNHIWLKYPFEAALMLRHPWF